MIKSLFDAVMAAGMFRLLLLPFLVAPFVFYLVLTSERRKKASGNCHNKDTPAT
jgi:hypothetical protein